MDFEVELYKIRLCVPEAAERSLVLGANAARILRLNDRGVDVPDRDFGGANVAI
jgi:hypothetical protein